VAALARARSLQHKAGAAAASVVQMRFPAAAAAAATSAERGGATESVDSGASDEGLRPHAGAAAPGGAVSTCISSMRALPWVRRDGRDRTVLRCVLADVVGAATALVAQHAEGTALAAAAAAAGASGATGICSAAGGVCAACGAGSCFLRVVSSGGDAVAFETRQRPLHVGTGADPASVAPRDMTHLLHPYTALSGGTHELAARCRCHSAGPSRAAGRPAWVPDGPHAADNLAVGIAAGPDAAARAIVRLPSGGGIAGVLKDLFSLQAQGCVLLSFDLPAAFYSPPTLTAVAAAGAAPVASRATVSRAFGPATCATPSAAPVAVSYDVGASPAVAHLHQALALATGLGAPAGGVCMRGKEYGLELAVALHPSLPPPHRLTSADQSRRLQRREPSNTLGWGGAGTPLQAACATLVPWLGERMRTAAESAVERMGMVKSALWGAAAAPAAALLPPGAAAPAAVPRVASDGMHSGSVTDTPVGGCIEHTAGSSSGAGAVPEPSAAEAASAAAAASTPAAPLTTYKLQMASSWRQLFAREVPAGAALGAVRLSGGLQAPVLCRMHRTITTAIDRYFTAAAAEAAALVAAEAAALAAAVPTASSTAAASDLVNAVDECAGGLGKPSSANGGGGTAAKRLPHTQGTGAAASTPAAVFPTVPPCLAFPIPGGQQMALVRDVSAAIRRMLELLQDEADEAAQGLRSVGASTIGAPAASGGPPLLVPCLSAGSASVALCGHADAGAQTAEAAANGVVERASVGPGGRVHATRPRPAPASVQQHVLVPAPPPGAAASSPALAALLRSRLLTPLSIVRVLQGHACPRFPAAAFRDTLAATVGGGGSGMDDGTGGAGFNARTGTVSVWARYAGRDLAMLSRAVARILTMEMQAASGAGHGGSGKFHGASDDAF